jgi:hypothetical protein
MRDTDRAAILSNSLADAGSTRDRAQPIKA